MSVYRRTSDGATLIPVRNDHRLDLRALTLTLYHSNEELGAELSVRAIRATVAEVLAGYGTEVVVRVADYITETDEYDPDSLVGGDVAARLEWARRMIVKAYGPELEQYPRAREALRAFEALTPKGIV
ncbi:hypothetical protein AB0E08_08395 [Streptomyces sp. NPDC048281]|uniref:hypothetical protein n=1 Tax=Streptomyces sp. NPDC048281 TaxID=3154715 RepID=UPI00342B0A40